MIQNFPVLASQFQLKVRFVSCIDTFFVKIGIFEFLPFPVHSLVKTACSLIHVSFNFHIFNLRLELWKFLRARVKKANGIKNPFLGSGLSEHASMTLALRGTHLSRLRLSGWKLKDMWLQKSNIWVWCTFFQLCNEPTMICFILTIASNATCQSASYPL